MIVTIIILIITVIIICIIIIITIFMMCRFNKYAGFMWSSCHAGVIRLLLETCAQILTILPTSSKHVSVGMGFPGLGIRDMSYQSCMTLRIGSNNIVGGSIITHPRPNSSDNVVKTPLNAGHWCITTLCILQKGGYK